MPVFDQNGTHLNFPYDHPLFGGHDAGPHLLEADAILVVEADAPWFPALKSPRPETPVIQVGHDPLFSRYPIRGFAVDLGLAGAPQLTLARAGRGGEAARARSAGARHAPDALGGRAQAPGRRPGRRRPPP